MKKKLTRYITMFVLALQGLTITSCSDWLDLMPNDGVPLDEFWKTKEDVRSVLNGAYLSMASSAMVQRLFLYGEAGGFLSFQEQFSRSKKFFSNFFRKRGDFGCAF